MEEFTPVQNKDYTPVNSNLENQTFDQVGEMFDYEKGGSTIDREMLEYKEASSLGKEKINEAIKEKKGFSLDDMAVVKETEAKPVSMLDGAVSNEAEAPTEDKGTVEEYFSSAEFVIFVIELVIVWGTNLYLKNNNLDPITIKEFEKTKEEEKFLIKSWAAILHKYSMKIGVEFELLFAMGSAYGMKLKGIVRKQQEKKDKEIAENRANNTVPIKSNVIPLKPTVNQPVNQPVKTKTEKTVTTQPEKPVNKKGKQGKPVITKDNFRLDVDDLGELESKIDGKKNSKNKGVADLIS